MKQKLQIKKLLLSFLIVFSVALIGSIFTSTNTDSEWYNQIKPSITPLSFVFPIVWNILFFLIAISLYLVWTNSKNKKEKQKIIYTFGINFILNILWSFLFFFLQKPTFALAEIFLIEISIIFMIKTSYKINKTSAYLLFPYLLWVGFAIILNWLTVFP